MAQSEARWYWNDGGPLVVLPSEQASAWDGAEAPRNGRVVDAVGRWNDPSEPATDYDRACDVSEPVALLGVGTAWGLVLSTELAQAAAWLPDESDARVTYLFGVANLDGDSDDALRDVLRTVPPDSWRVLDLDLRIGDGLLLLHAANRSDEVRVWPARTLEVPERGAVIGEALAQPMVPGRYELASAEIHTPAGDFAAIARFTLQEPAA